MNGAVVSEISCLAVSEPECAAVGVYRRRADANAYAVCPSRTTESVDVSGIATINGVDDPSIVGPLDQSADSKGNIRVAG